MLALFHCLYTGMMDVWMISRCSYSFYSCIHLLGNLLCVPATKFSLQHFLGITPTFCMWIYNPLLPSSACLHILYQHYLYNCYVFKSSNNLTHSCHRQFWKTLFLCLLLAGCLLGILFDPEDGGSAFLWYGSELQLDSMALHPRR
jgi:hypothetical protein